jgi:hypothetical protein
MIEALKKLYALPLNSLRGVLFFGVSNNIPAQSHSAVLP